MVAEVIRYDGVSKHFDNVVAVDDVSFAIEKGELLALLGPSGSGKTTTLRMLAGFETPTAGNIHLDDKEISEVPPHKRDTSMVFQDYALFPHMTVEQNIKFGLKRRGYGESEADERVAEVLSMVDMSGLEGRTPENLSGGQQQRVATARAIAPEPSVLLMDEPLGALDKKLRDQLQVELINLLDDLNITTLYVTHNQEEALTMADRIAVMNEGQIEQIAPPTEIYEDPATPFVAEFIGDTNFIRGDVSAAADTVTLHLNGQKVELEREVLAGAGEHRDASGTRRMFIRPERITLARPDEQVHRDITAPARLEQVLFLGSKIRYRVRVGGELFTVDENADTRGRFTAGDDVLLAWNADDIRVTGGEA